MTTASAIRYGRLAALVGGALWLGLFLLGALHDFWESPIGPLTYERYNRLQTLPLLLFVAGWVVIDTRYASQGSRPARAASKTVLLGFLLLLAGNVLEFWVILLQSRYVPFRLGGPDAWPGAVIGWTLFLFGIVVLFAGLLLFGIATLRARLLPRWNGVPLITAIAGISGIMLAIVGERLGVNGESGIALALIALGINWLLLGLALNPAAQPAHEASVREELVTAGTHGKGS